MENKYELKQLLSMTKKQLINLAGYRNAKHLLKDGFFNIRGLAFLPSRKGLARMIHKYQ